jgi:hypothetical protein
VFRVNIKDSGTFEALKNVYDQEEYDFWSPPSLSNPTDILVPPQQVDSLKSFLGLLESPFEVMKENLQ